MQRDRIVAAFDFDGTITTSDSLRDFVHHVDAPHARRTHARRRRHAARTPMRRVIRPLLRG
jgi:2-hydroxy-3-keto-5-methylthiopentenyl-1-phosphate phosphatase